LSASAADRGRIAQDDGEYETAADYFGQATRQLVFNPDNVGAEAINLYALAVENSAGGQSNLKLAMDRAVQAERLDPYDGQHYQLEGRIWKQQGELAKAKAAFEQALKLDQYNHPEYAFDLARVQVELGQTAAAKETIRAMLVQYPQSVVANRVADESLKFRLAQLKVLDRQLQSGPVVAPR
jgi:tetratricopeptide (TPR) repeat protein